MDPGMIHGIWSLLILLIFIGIVAYVWRRGRREHYDRAAHIPFDQEDELQDRRSRKDRTSNNNV